MPQKHIVFDVVGTCVSYSSLIAAIDSRLGAKLRAVNVSPALLTFAWVEAGEREHTYLSMGGAYVPSFKVMSALFHRVLYQAGIANPREFASEADKAAILKGYESLVPRDGLKECFEKLRKAGFTVWAFTAGDTRRVLGYFRTAGVEFPAENFLSCDDIGVGKPDPRAYESVLKRFDEGDEKWFAAAHMWDVSSARRVGFKGAFCSVYEGEPCSELFGEMDVMADTLPEMADKVIAKAG